MQIANNIEHWALIDGYDNYEISSFGRVRNNETCRILKGSNNGNGYNKITLCKEKKEKKVYVHRLVAFAFCEKKDEYDIVDHIDQNKINNHFTNLRWVNKSLNGKNIKTRNTNTSGNKGVCYHKGGDGWLVRWNVDNKSKSKFFKNKDDAIVYRLEMEQLNGYL